MKPLAALGLLLCLLSCDRGGIPLVVREDLFSLGIGMMEDQIDLFNLEGSSNTPTTNIAMRDGLFHISSGPGRRVSRYTSYGDVLFMVYNEETNPPPLTLRGSPGGGELVTRRAFPWPLSGPGKITVDSRNHVHVEDRLPPDRRSADGETGALLDGIVLHFDDTGRFVDYLGQEGLGGTPFPRIDGLYTSVDDELVVVCRLPSGWKAYWFDSGASVRYLLTINAIPVPPDRPGVFSSVDTIMAAPDRRLLFMKVDYYRAVNDESTGTRAGVAPDSSVVWILDAETGHWTDGIEVPFYERPAAHERDGTEKLFYSLLGVIREGRVFLSFPVEGGYSILALQAGGPGRPAGDRRQGFIRVDDGELEYNSFFLSPEGILSALLATEEEARLVWWRTDRLASGLLQ